MMSGPEVSPPPQLPLNDGYYRIRSLENLHSITMIHCDDKVNLALNKAEADTEELMQTFYVRFNQVTETYTIRNMSTGLYLGTVEAGGWAEWGCTGTTKPQPWAVDIHEHKQKRGYRIFLSGFPLKTNGKGTFVTLWQGKDIPGLPIGTTHMEDGWHRCRLFNFEPLAPPYEVSVFSPLATLPPILPGNYKLQNVMCHTFLTQSDEDPDSAVVGDPLRRNKIQNWKVTIDRETQMFFLQSDEGYYLATDRNNGSLIAAAKPQLWEIRQGELIEQFVIHVPNTNWVLHMENTANNAMMIGLQRRDAQKVSQQRWILLPEAFDPKIVSHAVPPLYPSLSNGVYRISNVKTRHPLTEGEALVDKTTNPGKIGPIVSCIPHICGREKELWRVEVQPNVLTYTVRNVVSGRYLCPPDTQGAQTPGPRAHPITSNAAYLWDIRHSARLDAFCIHIPGTNLVLHAWGNSKPEEGHVVMWGRSLPDVPQEGFRFHPVGDWQPASFPTTALEVENMSGSGATAIAELAAAPALQQRNRTFVETVVHYTKRALGADH